jgi:hypothetical protein
MSRSSLIFLQKRGCCLTAYIQSHHTTASNFYTISSTVLWPIPTGTTRTLLLPASG